MSYNEIKAFGVVDYCFFAAMLIVSTGIGVIMSFRGNKTPEDFFFGNRAFKPIPVAMSLLTSVISSISLLGYSGEAFTYGLQFSLMVAGVILAIIFCNFVAIPVLFPLRLTSINEYIYMRFRSKPLLLLVLFLSILSGFFYSGICLYAPTLALSSVTPLSIKTYIYLLGVICTIYSTIGGIKAVVWTDVFQLTVVVIGLTVILILGCYNVGGITKVWEIAIEGGKFEIFNMSFGLYEHRTFFNVIIFGFFYFTAIHGTSQLCVQRMNCVQTIQEAKFVLLSNILGYLVVYFFIFTCGVMCYATYVGCDPLALGRISKSDQILTFFVVDQLGYVPGLPGIFVATIIGGALSSLSSVISSQVSMIWKDCLLQFQVFTKATPQVAAIINKVLSFFVGGTIIGMALFASSAESLLQINMVVSGASGGPVMGLFTLGLLFPKCSTKGAWCGLLLSWVFMCWISVGGLMYQDNSMPFRASIENCTEFTNSSSLEFDRYYYHKVITTNRSVIEDLKYEEDGLLIMWLYGISPTMYPAIGPLMCIAIGLITSIITGHQNLSEVSPLLIVPCVRRFYWNKQELLRAEEKPTALIVEITPNLRMEIL